MYTIQHFISKFSAIPWYKWCKTMQCNKIGQKCAFGHITPNIERGSGCVSSKGNPEMIALEQIGDKYFRPGSQRQIALINNGKDKRFQQRTCKARVIAALKYAQQLEAQEIIDSAFANKTADEDKILQTQ